MHLNIYYKLWFVYFDLLSTLSLGYLYYSSRWSYDGQLVLASQVEMPKCES